MGKLTNEIWKHENFRMTILPGYTADGLFSDRKTFYINVHQILSIYEEEPFTIVEMKGGTKYYIEMSLIKVIELVGNVSMIGRYVRRNKEGTVVG